MIDWGKHAADLYGEMPQPEPGTGRPLSVKVKDYPTALKLATATKFGGHAEPKEAELFWKEFEPLGMSPQDYLHQLDIQAPLAFRYTGRPPTMKEIADHRDKSPRDMRDYYTSLPHKLYPEVSTGDMVHMLSVAEVYSRQHAGRLPTWSEVRTFVHGKFTPRDINDHYDEQKKREVAQKEAHAVRSSGGGNPGNPVPANPGGQPPDPGVDDRRLGRQGAAAGGPAGPAQGGEGGTPGALPAHRDGPG